MPRIERAFRQDDAHTVDATYEREARVHKMWDDERGEYWYHLEIQSFKVLTIRIAHHTDLSNSGDRAWAERQAEHYGIEIEDSE